MVLIAVFIFGELGGPCRSDHRQKTVSVLRQQRHLRGTQLGQAGQACGGQLIFGELGGPGRCLHAQSAEPFPKFRCPRLYPIGRLGKRVEDSSAENDWGEETKQDILGDIYTTMKTPVISQTFDPCELDSGDEYQHHVWELAVVDQDAPALCNQDRRGPPG